MAAPVTPAGLLDASAGHTTGGVLSPWKYTYTDIPGKSIPCRPAVPLVAGCATLLAMKDAVAPGLPQ
jgi:hypothetical protein